MCFYHKRTILDKNDFIVDMPRKIYIFVILLRKKIGRLTAPAANWFASPFIFFQPVLC